MSEESESLLGIEQLTAYVSTVDAAEAAAKGEHFKAMLILGTAWDADQPHTMSALLGWMVASIQMLAHVNGMSIEEMAAQLRASGAR